MIEFKRVKYKNLLSTGNQFNEFILDSHPTTLITGDNGAGKSTMLDAICWGLYGKAFRNISKSQIVNSLNKRDCVVEIEFVIGSREYKVVRGIGPAIFDIYCDGKVLPRPASVADYQKNLEQNILKMRINSFRQVVCLGSASHTPFMLLGTGERRKIVEDLLDIEIFSLMNDVLGTKRSDNKVELTESRHELDLVNQSIAIKEGHIEKIKVQQGEKIKVERDNLEKETNNLESQRTAQEKLSVELAGLNSQGREDELDSVNDLIYQLKTNATKYKKEYDFFEKNSECPTCTQHLPDEIRDTKKTDAEHKRTECDHAITELGSKQSAIQTILDRCADLSDKIKRKVSEIEQTKKTISLYSKRIKELEAEVEEMDTSELESEKKKLKVLEKDMESLILVKDLYDVAYKLLRDDGIKAQIIKQYVPIINHTANVYLQRMGLPIRFELDESFKEIVRSRYQDEFKYENFSMGERQRIDLALLLTWRAIAKSRGSVSTNLLILDETFDSSLDASGTEELIKIIYDLTGTNIFIISHKGEILADKFSRTINVKKQGNFSVLSVE